MHFCAVGLGTSWACEEFNQLVLRCAGPTGGLYQGAQGVPSRIEQSRRGLHVGEGTHNGLPRFSSFVEGDLTLAHQDLPQSDFRLEHTHRVAAKHVAWDFLNGVRGMNKAGYCRVV